MGEVFVHPRVHERHPNLSDVDVRSAWDNCIVCRPRLDVNPDMYVAIGLDGKNRLVEMVAIKSDEGNWLIYHALTPPSTRVLRELDAQGRY